MSKSHVLTNAMLFMCVCVCLDTRLNTQNHYMRAHSKVKLVSKWFALLLEWKLLCEDTFGHDIVVAFTTLMWPVNKM